MFEKLKILKHMKQLKQIYSETPKTVELALEKLDITILKNEKIAQKILGEKELRTTEKQIIYDYLILLRQIRNRIDDFMTAEKKVFKMKCIKGIVSKCKDLKQSKIGEVISDEEYKEYARNPA